MAGFSDSSFIKKLTDLNPSQQSIQTLSLWLIHHRRNSKTITELWYKELKKAKPSKKLTFLYLANDVIQNSKKKGTEFNTDFRRVLPDAFKHTLRDADDKIKKSLERLVGIWKERGVFEPDFTYILKRALAGKHRSEKEKESVKPAQESKKEIAKVERETSTKKKPKKAELSLREEMEAELSQAPIDAPEPEELVAALEALEHAASTDAKVREQIAAYPTTVAELSHIDKFTDKQGALQFAGTVDEVATLMKGYNERLAAELEDRRKVAQMIHAFILVQKEALADTETKLEESKTRLTDIGAARKDLKAHMQSLPDLTLLPDLTGGLAPLPAAGDLFAIEKDF